MLMESKNWVRYKVIDVLTMDMSILHEPLRFMIIYHLCYYQLIIRHWMLSCRPFHFAPFAYNVAKCVNHCCCGVRLFTLWRSYDLTFMMCLYIYVRYLVIQFFCNSRKFSFVNGRPPGLNNKSTTVGWTSWKQL